MQALWHLAEGNAEFLIVPIQATLKIMPPPEHFQRCIKGIDKTFPEGPYALAELLRKYGFTEKDLVTSRGEFSLRGAILDLFSPAEESPVRIEFFGNRIESMRIFDTATQRSFGEDEKFTLLSMRELILTRQEIENWGEFCKPDGWIFIIMKSLSIGPNSSCKLEDLKDMKILLRASSNKKHRCSIIYQPNIALRLKSLCN